MGSATQKEVPSCHIIITSPKTKQISGGNFPSQKKKSALKTFLTSSENGTFQP